MAHRSGAAGAAPNEMGYDGTAMGDTYVAEGVRRAAALGNRGPLEFTADGALAPHIDAAYWRTGFYIFEGVFGDAEVADLVADFDRFLERAPTSSTATTDAAGRPALSPGPGTRKRFTFGKPLGDPFGGTGAARGRYQARMTEYDAPDDAPEEVLVKRDRRVAVHGQLPAAVRPPATARGSRAHQWPRLRAVPRGAVDQGGGPRAVHRLAPGRHHPLEQPETGRRHARLQLHGAALSHHGRERAVAHPRLALQRQDRHQGARGGQRRLRPPAGRRADGVRARRTSPWSTARSCTARSPTAPIAAACR